VCEKEREREGERERERERGRKGKREKERREVHPSFSPAASFDKYASRSSGRLNSASLAPERM